MISEICIFDMANRTTRCLLRADWHLEAPNWSRDGQELIVNSKGRLFRMCITDPDRPMAEIDTGFATRCNNDHGISPDGQNLVISDKSETNQSTIYTLPYGGGVPRRVTANAPSYWHGWSPDGAELAYVARRDAGFQVYTIPAEGGPERALTSDFDHCDGPDYTPDGAWIWFNGEKAGQVDLWRMRPDGSKLQRMTEDTLVNWFPHPSPDGQHIVYLAYPAGTFGHPPDLPVTLRLMPAAGGPSEVLARFRGGQGTINVPSWAPDGHAFAYVRYPEAA